MRRVLLRGLTHLRMFLAACGGLPLIQLAPHARHFHTLPPALLASDVDSQSLGLDRPPQGQGLLPGCDCGGNFFGWPRSAPLRGELRARPADCQDSSFCCGCVLSAP